LARRLRRPRVHVDFTAGAGGNDADPRSTLGRLLRRTTFCGN
jgi:hypothetical protein